MKVQWVILVFAISVFGIAWLLDKEPAPDNLPQKADQSMIASSLQETVFEHPAQMEATTNEAAVQNPVEPLEERGDAMLFEIDALQGTPFDQSILTPYSTNIE